MIEVNKKYGCLTVLEDYQDYKTSEQYLCYLNQKECLFDQIKRLKEQNWNIKEKEKFIDEYKRSKQEESEGWFIFFSFENDIDGEKLSVEDSFSKLVSQLIDEYNEKIKELDDKYDKKRYKCQCKCGKIYYYTEETLMFNPRYCFYPISIANLQFNYSSKAQKANRNKRLKYKNKECVKLWEKAPSGAPWWRKYDVDDESIPSDEYCELYNRYKIKQLKKKENEYNSMIAKLPREFAENYDVDYVGKNYESLEIVECVNQQLEDKPRPFYTQMPRNGKRKHWSNIIVHKQYRCICKLCNKEQLVNCDKFGINPPTEYGYHAYHGYWSDTYCDCHPISSFQWIVCKILWDNNVDYEVEYSFDDLVGVGGINLLRFDFAIKRDGKLFMLIECQGEQHYMPVDELGGEQNYQRQILNDSLKRKYAENHNIPLIEISYKDKDYNKIYGILRNHKVID